jgi:hypothetical protein
VKFLRLLLISLGLLLALAGVLVGAAFLPFVQTWVTQGVLDGHPGLHGSVGSVSARFGQVEVADLQLEVGGAGLTIPSIQASLPLLRAVRKRELAFKSLVAKGWTVDLSRAPAPEETPAPAQPEAAAAKKAVRLMGGILSGWTLPCDVSLDEVELEGDVLVAGSADAAPVRVHVTAKGGGLAAGRPGAFTVEATATNSWSKAVIFAVHARLAASMDTPRSLDRVELQADCSAQGGSFPEGFAWLADIAATRTRAEEVYTLDLSQGHRHLANLTAHSSAATGRLEGAWKVDLQDADVLPFFPDRPLPAFAAAGEGRFETDPDFVRVQVHGRLDTALSRLDGLAPALDRVGAVTLATRFNLSRSGPVIRFEELDISLAAGHPVAALRALQPFEIDAKTGEMKLTDPHADWMEGSLRGLPLAWLPGWRDYTLAGDDATGDFVLQLTDGGFALRAKKYFVATGVAVQRAGRTLGPRVDVTLALHADYGPQGWQVQGVPLTFDHAGRRMATLEAKAARQPGTDQPVALSGKWSTDLEALVALEAIPEIAGLTARSASGEFYASVGTLTEMEGQVAVVGHDPGHTLTASLRGERDASGTLTLSAPVKFTLGTSVSEMLAEGSWAGEEAGGRVNVKLTGETISLEQLRRLAIPLAGAAGIPWPVKPAPGTGGPDRKPFWGDRVGNLTVAFDHLQAGDQTYDEVGGSLDFDHGSVHLERGRGGLPHRSPVEVEGWITFEAGAEFPYRIKATATLGEFDAATIFGAAPAGQDPVIEGHFALAGTLTGEGATLGDLVARVREEFHLTGKGGIIRLLRTSIGDAITEAPPSSVSDTVNSVGSFMGSLLKVKGGSGEKPVSKATQAALDITSLVAELGYDRIAITAVRDHDNTLHLVDIAITTPEESLTGTGRITGAEGKPWRTQPLSLDLKLGVRGTAIKPFTAAGLLVAQPDKLGYTPLRQAIHFGGTLEQIDVSAWHDLLVKAAGLKPSGG